jgi:2-keto-4-pentenoate hydratase/2-oxohepta-3-ene-1,7-dioic acid hydratase in catechol pathway
LKLGRIITNSGESLIIIKDDKAITQQEIKDQAGVELSNNLVDLLAYDSVATIERLLPRLKFLHDTSEFKFTYPIQRPPKIIFLNFNYVDQAGWIRFGKHTPQEPIFYLKPCTCLNGPFDEIRCPKFVTQLDFEGEMAIVIGKGGKNLSSEDALLAICGFMVMNDVSARDIQYTDIQVSRSKCFDTFAPCGPWITTRSEIEDPDNLRIVARVNGEVRQDSNTHDMVLKCEEIVSKLSKVMTLEPGDIISTGTPMGSILSSHGRKPWLRNDDLVEVEVQNLGVIKNKIVFE